MLQGIVSQDVIHRGATTFDLEKFDVKEDLRSYKTKQLLKCNDDNGLKR